MKKLFNVCFGLTAIIGGIVGLLAIISNEEKSRKKDEESLDEKTPPARQESPVPHFLCWFCHGECVIPGTTTTPDGLYLSHCVHCQKTNEISMCALSRTGEIMVGQMNVAANRCTAYFEKTD